MSVSAAFSSVFAVALLIYSLTPLCRVLLTVLHLPAGCPDPRFTLAIRFDEYPLPV